MNMGDVVWVFEFVVETELTCRKANAQLTLTIMPPKGRVLVLGAGFVTRPLVHYLSQCGFHVIVADLFLTNAETLIKGRNV
jgi:xanthine/CO dehydrogenase XdhC/CoxF family maturation factor